MKKKFNILGALVCAVVLGFAGCDTVQSILDSWWSAIQEALGLNQDHDIIANGTPVAIDEGTYTFKVNFSGLYTGRSDEYENSPDVYVYASEENVATVNEDGDASNAAYQWELEKTGDYTFKLKNKLYGTYMTNAFALKNMILVSNEDKEESEIEYEYAEMQMWYWEGANIIVLANKDNDETYNESGTTGDYNAYWYPIDQNTIGIHWWGRGDNEELKSVLAVMYDEVTTSEEEPEL